MNPGLGQRLANAPQASIVPVLMHAFGSAFDSVNGQAAT